jgi:hypothetical protein
MEGIRAELDVIAIMAMQSPIFALQECINRVFEFLDAPSTASAEVCTCTLVWQHCAAPTAAVASFCSRSSDKPTACIIFCGGAALGAVFILIKIYPNT